MGEERIGAATLKGNPLTLSGHDIRVGEDGPDFSALNENFEVVRLSDARGKVVILSAIISVDTPVSDTVIRRFNQKSEEENLGNSIEIWVVSMDLPFVQKRWCEAAGVKGVKTLSDFRFRSFSESYGLLIKDGPFAGVSAPGVFIIGKDGKVKYVEYVKDIATEPNYEEIFGTAKVETLR
jgi:thioredoxin-dependent peroxiredoxin